MTDHMLQLAGRLFFNGLRFQYQKRTGSPGKPQAISLEITHHCIARCIMCNIWKIPREVRDLSMDRWIHLLSSDLLTDLRELDITGGEPFLRNDLPELFSGICELKQKNLKSLASIAVTTNGILTDRVLDSCRKILEMLNPAHIDLVVVCAMDAIGELHDRIRNYKDAWSKVDRTIRALKALREEYPNLIIGLKTTVLPINIHELEKISLYADSHGLFTIISPCIITEGRYLNPDRAADLVFNQRDKEMMVTFYKSKLFRWSFHAQALAQYFSTGMVKKPCSCGFNYFFVRSTGQVLLCPLRDESVGNIQDAPLGDLFFSKKACRMRRKIGRYTECEQCTEPGLERYALPYQGFTYLSYLLKQEKPHFFQLHHHMGLDKFF